MGINPIPTVALIVTIRLVVALATRTTYDVPGFGLDEAISLFSVFVLGTIPGAPVAIQAIVGIVTTGTLVYAIVQLLRGV